MNCQSNDSTANIPQFPKPLIILFIIIIIAAVAGGIYITGGPEHQRLKRIDEKRLSKLSSIRYDVEGFYRSDDALPENIDALRNAKYQSSNINSENYIDPVPGQSIEYTKTSDTTYQLCAHFDTSNQQDEHANDTVNYTYYGNNNWKHPKGRHCFELKAPKKSEKEN